ncbi:macro domain-containing protein [Toxoplasma gondii TgCatPRC2]|uniref:Appr-1-p processing enzyme family domain-containing protein n=10 Tax=Toxoplasma gondii TaxID=5811 RepID=A0A125YLD6_TOXGV|nr:macro domain-containing protein [Toxoplasma gondii ME49]ESS35334.1 macro domain-containing protein [Toxoplasma gondii VEG]KFG36817.1 macro domain-containing protein [Toxoplasma gondii GAB2-2007-GAL-DOM2]KFG49464.1 macro domain-containing protein [Toxoplasma gondii p89]KFG56360.1 macro domain-containing protein [Toxoplasma gondii FOU]KFH18301.1 macro domain-containing protein [Toxoplasma gondii MAS]KYF40201.1 macro domain-containing protein [Toxoplasma gondii ARI]KYK65686.1 macro domain-co|eukprot:XP_018635320.1 macro domain-containing protein [Toxoplasma gondii ME49]
MALSIGAAVSDAIQWLSSELRRTLDDEMLADSPALGLPSSPFSSRRPSPCYSEADCFLPSPVRRTAPAAAVSLDCLLSWQDTLDEASCDSAPLDVSSTPSTCGESPGGGTSDLKSRLSQTSSGASPLCAAQRPLAGEASASCTARRNSPFPVDPDLNRRLFLYYGDPCSLKVDAVVCFINEAFKPIDHLGARLALIGGDELVDEQRHLERCKAGEARICRSFNLPSSHIIYTVGPRCNSKYVTATHNALNSCLRESLLLLGEKSLSSVAVPLYSPGTAARRSLRRASSSAAALRPHNLRRMQPREDSESLPGRDSFSARDDAPCRDTRETPSPEVCRLAGEDGDEADAFLHTSLRSLRRWMEKLREKLDAVVLIVDDCQDMRACEAFVGLYFPRNEAEEAAALRGLPEEVGDACGQIEVAERRMRVEREGSRSSLRASPSLSRGEITSQFGSLFMPACDSDADEDPRAPFEEASRILNSADVSFTDAKACTETEKRLQALSAPRDLAAGVDSEALYHRYLRQASAIADCTAFKQLDAVGFLSPRGTDRAGRPLILFFAALFPSTPVDAHLVLLYIIKSLDPYIRDKYTLLYVNTEVHHSHMPSMALWKEFFHLFSQYENTLDQLLVLHPGLLFKAAFACMRPYLPAHLWHGTFYLDSIKDLSMHVDDAHLLLPNFVVEFDKRPRKKLLGLSL